MDTIRTYILTGFLGAGKTTLLNSLLKEVADQKNVVIENEFGKVNIDAGLIEEKFDELYELTNGCVCCSLETELVATLSKIVQSEQKFDNLFIETTGVADPGSIINIFEDEEVRQYFTLCGAVAVVDVETLADYLQENEEVARQMVFADMILLNKTDVVLPDYVDRMEELASTVNPFAALKRTTHSSGTIAEIEAAHSVAKNNITVPQHNSKPEHRINNVLFSTSDRFDMEQLQFTLSATLFIYYAQMYRVKGYVQDKAGTWFTVQSTAKKVRIEPLTMKGGRQPPESQLVFIGRGLKTPTVERILRPCLAKKTR